MLKGKIDLILPLDKSHFITGITDLTKREAENIAREKGWLNIIQLTWFCHNPIFGKPCGICNPCKDAMNENMEWRMPKISQWRYKYLNHTMGRKICALLRIIEKKTS